MHPSDFAKGLPRTTEEKAAAAYASAQARQVSLLSAFERALRVTHSLYERLERDMHSGLAVEQYNTTHARDAVALSRALAQAGAVHARLLEHEAARADALSEDQKREYMLQALRKAPLSIRQEFAARLMAP